jgi:hypothetical protein
MREFNPSHMVGQGAMSHCSILNYSEINDPEELTHKKPIIGYVGYLASISLI